MCTICGDIGYIQAELPLGHYSFGRILLCVCQQKRISERLQARLGTRANPRLRLADIHIRGGGSRSMKAAAERFIKSPQSFLTVYGLVDPRINGSSANGNGKTTCLQVVVNECIERGVAALYITVSDLVDFLKEGIRDESYDVEDRLAVLCGIPVLCMDEASQPDWTEWVSDKLVTLINRRYQDGKLGTVIALDDDPYLFFHRRIVSRLEGGMLVANGDPDMRPAFKRQS